MLTDIDTAVVIEPLETRLRARVATLRDNRERFIADAQRQLAALDAAIAEMDALLTPPPANQNGTESDESP